MGKPKATDWKGNAGRGGDACLLAQDVTTDPVRDRAQTGIDTDSRPRRAGAGWSARPPGRRLPGPIRLSTATGSDDRAMTAEMEILAKLRARRDVPNRHICTLAEDAPSASKIRFRACAETSSVGVTGESWKRHYHRHHELPTSFSRLSESITCPTYELSRT